MEENIMNEVVETAAVENDVVVDAGTGVTKSPMNFGTGIAAGAIATVAAYGAFKLGKKLVAKYKEKKEAKNPEDKNTASVEVDGKTIEGEIVKDKK